MRFSFWFALTAALTSAAPFLSDSRAEPPVTASRAPESRKDDLQGFWQGAIEVGAIKLRIWARVTRAQDGSYAATLDSPDQGAKDIPVSAVTARGDSVRLELKNLGAAFDGTLDATGNTLTGAWHQGGQSLPLVLTRGEEQQMKPKPQ